MQNPATETPDTLPAPDTDRLNALLGRMVGDLGAIATGALVLLGDRLGLYRAMRNGRRFSSAELARATGTHERYVREWLAAQAAAGYVTYDDGQNLFYLTPEQAAELRPAEPVASRDCHGQMPRERDRLVVAAAQHELGGDVAADEPRGRRNERAGDVLRSQPRWRRRHGAVRGAAHKRRPCRLGAEAHGLRRRRRRRPLRRRVGFGCASVGQRVGVQRAA